MMKTENDIERDFYSFVKNSVLGREIQGEVYRSESRPYNATTEDVVVTFLAGTDEQIQNGIILLNIYVSDVPSGSAGRKIKNHQRIGQLQTAVKEFVRTFSNTEYLVKTEATPRTYEVEGLDQHIIAARITFKRLSEIC